jgi:hypothetical protein
MPRVYAPGDASPDLFSDKQHCPNPVPEKSAQQNAKRPARPVREASGLSNRSIGLKKQLDTGEAPAGASFF